MVFATKQKNKVTEMIRFWITRGFTLQVWLRRDFAKQEVKLGEDQNDWSKFSKVAVIGGKIRKYRKI